MKKKWLSLPLACILFISACNTPEKNLPSAGSTGTTTPTRVSSGGVGNTSKAPPSIVTVPQRNSLTSTSHPTNGLSRESQEASVFTSAELTPAMPVCSRESFRKEFDDYIDVFTISCETIGAQIYYSINGGEYQKYTDSNEIYFIESITLTTYAELPDGRKSDTNTYTYELLPRYSIEVEENSPEAEKVTVRIETAVKDITYYYTIGDSEYILFPGLLEVEKDVVFHLYKVEADVSDVTFYYTTDGSEPTQNSQIYAGPLEIEKNAHFRVLAVKEGWKEFRQGATFSLTSSGDSKLENYQNKHFYKTLPKNEQEAYELIYAAFKDQKDTVDLFNLEIPVTELYRLWFSVYFENPKLFYQPYVDPKDALISNGKYIEKLDLAKIYKRSNEIEENCEDFDNVIKEVIKEAQKRSSDYERIRYIHDWIVRNMIYGDDEKDGAYVKDTVGVREPDSLIYRKADCCGYSRIFCYLAQSLGYDAIIVSGEAGGEGHAWNAIQIGDVWYLVDVLWDEIENKDENDSIGYRYFLRSEEEFSIDHEINKEEYVHPYPEFNNSFA